MLHEIPKLAYVAPRTEEEAVYWLSKYGEKARVLAGGTDLLGLIKDRVTGPQLPATELLVDIKKIPRMKGIRYDDTVGLRIGAATTLTELEESPPIREKFGIIAQAAAGVATLQIRNVGTVGGNLCQRPWCWYFRSPSFQCFKKGGKQCYAITGEHAYYFSNLSLGTCIMSHPSDLAPVLMVLGATLMIVGPNGPTQVPISQFFNGPKDVFENILEPNEIIVEISVPDQKGGTRAAYVKNRVRGAMDFSLASAAVSLAMSGGLCTGARIVLGGVAPFPYQAKAAERILVNNPITEDLVTEAARKEFENAKELPMNGYKKKLGQAVLKRAVLAARGHYNK